MKPGIHYGVPFSDYLKIQAMSATALKALSASYRDWEKLKYRPNTKTLAFGSLAHTAILEPDMLSRCIITPEKRENEKGKMVKFVRSGKHWKEFEEEHVGKEIVTATDFAKVEFVVSSIAENQTAIEYLSGDHEVTIVWKDPIFGLSKLRADALNIKQKRMGDLKTTQSIDPYKFGRSSLIYRYDIQAAWYLRGAKACGLDIDRFYFIPVETQPPHDSTVLLADELMLAEGENGIQQAADNLNSGKSSSSFTGKFPGVGVVEFPIYEEEITGEME